MSQAGILSVEGSDPQVPTQFDTDSGNAIPIANILEVLGTNGITTSGSGNTVTISLTGGGAAIDEINVDANTAPGTDPVLPNVSGSITVTGGQVASSEIGANVIRTNSLAANSYTIEVQQSGSAAASNTALNGVSHFNSDQFSVSNGFVSLAGQGLAIDSIDVQTGTTPILPNSSGLITINGAVVAAGTNPVRTDGTGANTLALEVQTSQALAAADATKIGLSNFDSSSFAVAATGFVTASGTGLGKTITGDTGGALSPTAGNWNIQGGAALSAGTNAAVTSGSGSTLTVTAINTAKWIVDQTANRGTHQTIASALTAASSGETIFIRPGTYTENLTLKAGVNLCAFTCDAFTPNVTISGTCTLTTAGSVSISGIRLQTNSAALLAVTGSVASIVNLNNCYLNCTNNTGITFSTSNAAGKINITNCDGNLGTTGIGLFAHSSAGNLVIDKCYFTNTGSSLTASTASAGSINCISSFFPFAITTSSTNTFVSRECQFDLSVINTTALTLGGSGVQTLIGGFVGSGSASAISISSSLGNINNVVVGSSNTNAITGSGTVTYNNISFSGTSSTINTTTQGSLVQRFGQQRSTTQPAFLAYSAGALNVTGDNTLYTVVFGTEIFDQANNFDGTSTFTAPVTGRYHLNTSLIFNDVGVAHTGGIMIIATSNRSYYFSYSNIGVTNFGGVNFGLGSVLADMDAADVATVTVQISGGTKVVDINALSNFSGNLFC